MVKRAMRWALCFALAAALAACSDGAGVLVPQPVAQAQAAQTFNLQAAFNNSITDTTPLAFSVEGTANGLAYDGAGSLEQGMLQSVAEFGSQGGALRKVTPVKMTLNIAGKPVNVETAAEDYYTRQELRLLGRIGPAPTREFIEVTAYNGLPTEAAVGASGTVYTANRYSDEGRRTLTGRTVATYTVEPDGSGATALLVMRVADDNADGSVGSVTSTVLRITQASTARRVSETITDAGTHSTLKATYF